MPRVAQFRGRTTRRDGSTDRGRALRACRRRWSGHGGSSERAHRSPHRGAKARAPARGARRRRAPAPGPGHRGPGHLGHERRRGRGGDALAPEARGHPLQPQEPRLRRRRSPPPLVDRGPGGRPLARPRGCAVPRLLAPAPGQSRGMARGLAHAARGQRLRAAHQRATVPVRATSPASCSRPARRSRSGSPRSRAASRSPIARDLIDVAFQQRSASPAGSSKSSSSWGARTTSSRSRWAAGSRSCRPTSRRRPRGSSSISWPCPRPRASPLRRRAPPPERGPARCRLRGGLRTVVIDPGHGGDDVGAQGAGRAPSRRT